MNNFTPSYITYAPLIPGNSHSTNNLSTFFYVLAPYKFTTIYAVVQV